MTDLVKAWQTKVRTMAAQFRRLFLASGRLIQEAVNGEYHKELGHESLQDYIQFEYSTGRFPVQWREAYDRLRVVKWIDAMALKDADVSHVPPISLKKLSGLNPEKYRDAAIAIIAAVKKDPTTHNMGWVEKEVGVASGKIKADAAPTSAEQTAEESAQGEKSGSKTFTVKVSPAEYDRIEKALSLFGSEKDSKAVRLVMLVDAVLAANTTATATK